MVRRCITIASLAILTASAAFAGDFHFAGRVDVIPVVDVRTATRAAGDERTTEILLPGSQDRCLDVRILPAAAGTAPQPAPESDRTATDRVVLPDTGSWRVLINLN